MRGARHIAVVGASVLLILCGCSEAGPPPDNRGRVIDQDTGLPIAGAIVVGTYMGSRGFESASSCDRVESAVSDADGWFTLPLRPNGRMPFLEAYHRGYKRGRGSRYAERAADGNLDHWQITVQELDANNHAIRILRIEPTIYYSQADALEASRQWKDIYLKPSTGTRQERLDELRAMRIGGSCGGTAQTSPGPVPFFEAIYAEQVELHDDVGSLELTRDFILSAEKKAAYAREHR